MPVAVVPPEGASDRLGSRLKQFYFTLDLRSLGLFRILLDYTDAGAAREYSPIGGSGLAT